MPPLRAKTLTATVSAVRPRKLATFCTDCDCVGSSRYAPDVQKDARGVNSDCVGCGFWLALVLF